MAIDFIKNKPKACLPARQGFTLFFAVLVGGLALAIGAAIYDITVRELDLSSSATQSQYAIFAADTGAECALYWDLKCPSSSCPSTAMKSAFATSSTFAAPTGPLYCGVVDSSVTPPYTAQNFITQGPPTGDLGRFPNCSNGGILCGTTPTSATSTFTVYFLPKPYCVTVEVAKSGNPTRTAITAHGYNNCPNPSTGAVTGPTRLERVLQVTY